jgi:hypothetical protein
VESAPAAQARDERPQRRAFHEREKNRGVSFDHLVRAGEPAIADDGGDQDRCNFPGLPHGEPLRPEE